MKLSTKSVAACVLVLLASALSACKSGPDVIFVREDLDLAGEPRQILKVIEPCETSIAYYNGDEWIVVDDVLIPAGWLVVSPALAEPEDVPAHAGGDPPNPED